MHADTYKRTVREAMQWWMAATCIRFVEKSSDPIVLSISNIPGYVAYHTLLYCLSATYQGT